MSNESHTTHNSAVCCFSLFELLRKGDMYCLYSTVDISWSSIALCMNLQQKSEELQKYYLQIRTQIYVKPAFTKIQRKQWSSSVVHP